MNTRTCIHFCSGVTRKSSEEKRQPKITKFFTHTNHIKQEPASHDYDGDDERGASPAIRASRTPSPAIRGSLTLSPHATNNERKSPKPNSSPRNAKSRESPGLLNHLAHRHMPEGTFIPISTTFRTIADSRRAAMGASRNLLQTFDQLPIRSHDPPQCSLKQVCPLTLYQQFRLLLPH